ncbi:MAG TPA: FAD-dependent oxidoreductase [Candidatus Saccharimonadia bacterium]|nr:FAD-dependent oxidoreductase [Candidatus Saccharimonadia bacterium]
MKKTRRSLLLLTCLALASTLAHGAEPTAPASESAYDVVVFGGTPAGIMSAVAAGRNGAKVVLIEPSYLIGGLMSGGLHKTDIGTRNTIGGLSREFFKRVLDYYTQTYGAGSAQVKALDYTQDPKTRNGYYFEPKIALKIFQEMLGEAGVVVRTKEQLQSVDVIPGQIRTIVTRHYETGSASQFSGTIFIDGTYEGDLMAQAGVMYRLGREARAEYNESLAGLTEGPAEYLGTGDHRVQSYNVRSTICVDPSNLVPIPKPKQYFRDAHAHLIKTVNAHGLKRLDQLYPDRDRWGEINGKMDPNKADFLGVNLGYGEGDYEQRARITAKVQDYWLSHWYMLQNDPELPEDFKADARRYGLPKDEYLESNHVTPQIYVRVSRRMQGRYFLTQRDVHQDRFKPDTICMGSYGTDCHGIQMIQTEHGIKQEGDFNGAADPYEIPYRCLTPHGVKNLLVVAAVSASHVAYASLRMEPVFMMLGHAGGLAAHLAVADKTSVQEVSIPKLQEKLTAAGMPLQAPYRPWVEIRTTTPGPYQPGKPIEFEVVERSVRSPLTRLAWTFDGSGELQAEGSRARFTFQHPGKYTVMLLAWQDEKTFALPALLDIQIEGGDSLNREVHYTHATIAGRWTRSRGPEIEYRNRVGLLDENKRDGEARAEFTTKLPKTGRYRVCVAYATAASRASNVPVEVKHADGATTVAVNQRKKDSPFAFTPIGEFRFKGDEPATVIFTNAGVDGHVQIDTVRWLWIGE